MVWYNGNQNFDKNAVSSMAWCDLFGDWVGKIDTWNW